MKTIYDITEHNFYSPKSIIAEDFITILILLFCRLQGKKIIEPNTYYLIILIK